MITVANHTFVYGLQRKKLLNWSWQCVWFQQAFWGTISVCNITISLCLWIQGCKCCYTFVWVPGGTLQTKPPIIKWGHLLAGTTFSPVFDVQSSNDNMELRQCEKLFKLCVCPHQFNTNQKLPVFLLSTPLKTHNLVLHRMHLLALIWHAITND